MKMLGTATRCADDTTQLSLLVSMIFLVALVGPENLNMASFLRRLHLLVTPSYFVLQGEVLRDYGGTYLFF